MMGELEMVLQETELVAEAVELVLLVLQETQQELLVVMAEMVHQIL
jgi:hypothetical protein